MGLLKKICAMLKRELNIMVPCSKMMIQGEKSVAMFIDLQTQLKNITTQP